MFTYSELIPDFYRYLLQEQTCNKNSITNYISWLKFLGENYHITSDFTEDDIDRILAEDAINRNSREKYNTSKSASNFQSTLRRFAQFLRSDSMRKRNSQSTLLRAEEAKIEQTPSLSSTQRQAIIAARVGQGLFRRSLLNYWGACAVTKLNCHPLLIASHIKPWIKSDNNERLDVYNGLLLSPNLDKMFDQGYISFDPDGKIIISRLITNEDKRLLNISSNMRLSKLEEKHQIYLDYHRNKLLMR